jgi:hypothetical protein
MHEDNPFKDLKMFYYLPFLGFYDAPKTDTVNFILYFIKGYLSAYPLDKRKKVAKYLKEKLSPELEEAYNLPSFSKSKAFIGNFIKQLDTIFTESM